MGLLVEGNTKGIEHFGLTFAVCHQTIPEFIEQGDLSHRSTGFWRTDYDLCGCDASRLVQQFTIFAYFLKATDGPLYSDRPLLSIDITPLEAKQLA